MLYETLDIIKWKEPKEDVSFGDVIDDVVRTVGGGGRNMVASSARWRGQRSGVPLHLLAISIFIFSSEAGAAWCNIFHCYSQRWRH